MSLVFVVTSEALLVILIGADLAWAVPKHIESFFAYVWPSQEKVFQKSDIFHSVHTTIAQAVNHKPEQEQKARSVLENFALESTMSIPSIHQNNLPAKPKSQRELKDHPLRPLFKADAALEIQNLEKRNCWKVILKTKARSSPLPLKWVFTHKTDAEGMLIRCRSRLVMRGDL